MNTQATTLYPFVPSGPNFVEALAFFAKLGFEKQWEKNGLAGLRFDDAQFILQDINIPEWQKNQMITFEVTNLDAYWSELEGLSLTKHFGGVKLKAPTEFPWGREIHIIDLAGVCWHVRQSTAAVSS